MLLTVDIGNSNIVFGCFENSSLYDVKRFQSYDTDVWKLYVKGLNSIKSVMIVSVVPILEKKLVDFLIEIGFPKSEIYYANTRDKKYGVYFGKNGVNPKELGSDLYINALANYHLYNKRVLSVDLGTASKFCVIEKDGLYKGTTIVPGMVLSLNALVKKAPLLPEIVLDPTPKIINNTTVQCLQSGIFFGYCSLVDGLIKKIKKEQGQLFVILTGGIGKLLHEHLTEIDKFIPDLTLQGAQILYRMMTEDKHI